MESFKIIYKILKILEKAMDYSDFDTTLISAEALGINKNRWALIIEMLIEDELITGASIIKSIGGRGIKFSDVHLTIKGLQYLEENSLIKKIAQSAKGVLEVMK